MNVKCPKCNGEGIIKIKDKEIDCYFCGQRKEINWIENVFGPKDYKDNLDKALMNNSRDDNLDIVKYLVDNGADIHAKEGLALQMASAGGDLEVVKYLIENGADIHAQSDAAITRACMDQHVKTFEYLEEVYKRNHEPLPDLSPYLEHLYEFN